MLKPGRAHSGAVLAGWLAAAVQTFGLLWPSWGSGQLLYRDFVAVPNPVWSARVIFAATGVTDGTLMKGVRFFGDGVRTSSLIMQNDPHYIRFVDSIHVTASNAKIHF